MYFRHIAKGSVCVTECGFVFFKETSIRAKCDARSACRYLEFMFKWDHLPSTAESEISDMPTQKRKESSTLGGNTEKICVPKKV